MISIKYAPWFSTVKVLGVRFQYKDDPIWAEIVPAFPQIHTLNISGHASRLDHFIRLIPQLPHLKRVYARGRWSGVNSQLLQSLEEVSGNLSEFVIQDYVDNRPASASYLLIRLGHQSRFEVKRLSSKSPQHLSDFTPCLSTVKELRIWKPRQQTFNDQEYCPMLELCTNIESIKLLDINPAILAGITHRVRSHHLILFIDNDLCSLFA